MIVFITVSAIYSLLIVSFVIGWFLIKNEKYESLSFSKISVVVAFKNESNHLELLLSCLKKQNYPEELFEIIMVDDNSTDNSYEICKNFELKKTLIQLSQTSGKKSAINEALKIAKGDLIVTTDADCKMNENWLNSINSFYQKTKAKMIIAPVVFETTNKLLTFENIQALEFASLIASTAGATGISHPIMCNGANLIYEKNVFFEFDNPLNDKYLSGDDTFLMFNILKKYPNSVKFLKNAQSIVYTKAQTSLKQFFNQRIRWASKTKVYTNFFAIFTALTVFIMNFSMFATLFLSLFNLSFLFSFLILFLSKSIVDIILLIPFLNFSGQKKLISLFIPLQVFYFLYISIIAVLSVFMKSSWKK